MPKVKKFNTRGEEFLEFLKTLGYIPPKHQKGEHYDYLFQDEDVFRLVKAMMRKIKPENIIGLEELQRYQMLKDEGMLLFGKELEDAVEREKAMELKIENETSAANAEEAELIKIIDEKKKTIERLSALNSILNETIEEQKKDDSLKQQQIANWEVENSNLDKQIQVERKMLYEKVDELQKATEDILTNFRMPSCDAPKSSLLCNLDWHKIMDDEDKLVNMIKPMIEKYGADLIRKASEKDSDSVIDAHELQRIFKQHEKDFERLKHSIIYEKVKEADLKISIAGDTGAFEKIEECLQEMKRLSEIDDTAVLRIMKNEMRTDNENLEEILKVEKERALDFVKNMVISELNDDIKELVDLKAQAKKKLQDFFEFVVEVLSVQKVRVDLMRELLKTEGRDGEKLAKQLMEQKDRLNDLKIRQDLITEGITEDKLAEASVRLFAVFKGFDIPLSVLESHTNTMVSLTAVENKAVRSKFEAVQKNDEYLRSCTKKMMHKHSVMKELYEQVKSQHLESEEEKLIQQLENVHAEMQEKLDCHNKNREQLVLENKNKKWALMKRMQMAIAQAKNTEQASSPHSSSSS